MQRLNGINLQLRLAVLGLSAAALFCGTAAHAEGARERPYVPVHLESNGTASSETLDRMAAGVREKLGGKPGAIVLLIHGFGQQVKYARMDYDQTAERFQDEARKHGGHVAVVGVHWNSYGGSFGKWMLEATGSRLTSLLGMKKAVANPYREKTALAREVGRTGARSLFFRLQDEFPASRLNVIAHSLGAEIMVSALEPGAYPVKDDRPVVQPERTLRVGMVTLIGADLDCDTFAKETKGARAALGRADLWWVTVPKDNTADAILELRRGAGKGDAIGNCGMKLEREDLDALLRRRALVVDQYSIPAVHTMVKYLCKNRIGLIATAMHYLDDPKASGVKDCILAKLDQVLDAPASELADLKTDDNCVKLYAGWRTNNLDEKLRIVRVLETDREEGQALNRSEKAQQPLSRQAVR